MKDRYVYNVMGHRIRLNAWIKEGIRVGKVPWCCDTAVEMATADILRSEFGITEQESQEETCKRREYEQESS